MLHGFFHNQPLFLLFLIIAVGYPLGRLRVLGVRLGMVAILLTGIFFGALTEGAQIPEIVYQFGLVLFVYGVGLSSGSLLRQALRGTGIPANLLTAGAVALTAALAFGAERFLTLNALHATGMYAGITTGTPALAAVLEYVKHGRIFDQPEPVVSQIVVGYSLAYPFSIFSVIAAVVLTQRWWRIDHAAEARQAGEGIGHTPMRQAAVKVTNPAVVGLSIAELIAERGWNISFGRHRRGQRTGPATAEVRLEAGDVLSVIGGHAEVQKTIAGLGAESEQMLHQDRSEIDYQRFFVSNPQVAGARLKDLSLPRQFGAVVTRVRRGDIEFVPHGSTILQPGDRVMIVARRDNMPVIEKFLGDSYRAVSEVNLLGLGMGVSLGLLLGLVPLPLGGGLQISLGYAGGPLMAGLILGAWRRTGRLHWTIPYSAHQTASQLGIVLFLAGIGTRAGGGFVGALGDGSALTIVATSIVISLLVCLLMLLIGHRVLKIPYGQTIGILAGMQTQSALLDFCVDQAGSDLPKVGYALVYPLASLGKIVVIQLLFAAL